jgi:hypothetical protein
MSRQHSQFVEQYVCDFLCNRAHPGLPLPVLTVKPARHRSDTETHGLLACEVVQHPGRLEHTIEAEQKWKWKGKEVGRLKWHAHTSRSVSPQFPCINTAAPAQPKAQTYINQAYKTPKSTQLEQKRAGHHTSRSRTGTRHGRKSSAARQPTAPSRHHHDAR